MELEKVLIDEDVKGSKVAIRAKEMFSPDLIEIIPKNKASRFESEGPLSASEFSRSKRLLHLTEFKGSFFKRCPGAKPGLSCCNYFVLNLGLQCDMNCTYCYLQSFINSRVMKVYTNIDRALNELKKIALESGDLKYRVGTGETIDSLSLDHLTLYSRELIGFFKAFPNWQLEFKTKSNQVDQFLDLGPAKNVVVSWSLNPQNIVEQEELGTASLKQRLDAAKKCLDHGFSIAFHIDPVIWHPNWEENYRELILAITQNFSPKNVPYISLGALRFQPNQRHMMRERFGMKSYVTGSEMFPSDDGKFRYDRKLRQEMFSFIRQEFLKQNKEWNIFLCMESPETWLSTYDKLPKKVEGLENLFDHRIPKHFSKIKNKNSARA